MKFVKMHGTSNDYVFVTAFEAAVTDPVVLAREVSSRHTGIGSDGLILLLPSPIADARMRIFNPDGSEAEMCGNGIRCAAKLLFDDGLALREEVTLDTMTGVRTVRLSFADDGKRRVNGAEVEMGTPLVERARPDREEMVLAGDYCWWGLRISVGNPHFVVFVDDPATIVLEHVAPIIERDSIFPNRTNVEFVRIDEARSITVRVWERGVGETQACGTGAVAAVTAATVKNLLTRGDLITVRLPGGEVTVRWDKDGPAWLAGDAVEVFRGAWAHKTEEERK